MPQMRDKRAQRRYVLEDGQCPEAIRHHEDIGFSRGTVTASDDLTALWPP